MCLTEIHVHAGLDLLTEAWNLPRRELEDSVVVVDVFEDVVVVVDVFEDVVVVVDVCEDVIVVVDVFERSSRGR